MSRSIQASYVDTPLPFDVKHLFVRRIIVRQVSAKADMDKVHPLLQLSSVGDTSYPEMVKIGNRLMMSY